MKKVIKLVFFSVLFCVLCHPVSTFAGQITDLHEKDRFLGETNIPNNWGKADTVVLANYLAFTDAFTTATLSNQLSAPILLSHPNYLTDETKRKLQVFDVKKVVIVGGTGSVSEQVASTISSLGVSNITRISGKDWLEVSKKNADQLSGNDTNIFVPPDRANILPNGKIKKTAAIGVSGSVKDNHDLALNFRKSMRPILYIVPHQDDEILSYGVDIRNELSRGRQVQLILLTRGEDSATRKIVNGQVYCQIHKTYHKPMTENYKSGGLLTPDQFADARTDEYYRATKALGVPENNIHTEFIPNGQYYGSRIRAIIEKYLVLYPEADIRSFSWFDEHSAHALIGKTIKGMQDDGILKRYQAKYLISINTDRFYKIPKPMPVMMNRIENPRDLPYLTNAINEYKRFDPQNGYYAIGYHSVQVQFDSLLRDPYVSSHY